ncbi:MAG: DUF362 domain-containing protein [Promethearchaeota archaeon]
MENQSLVYWAPPYEIPSLIDSKRNLVTNNLVKTRLLLDKILDNINLGDKVGIKLHFGESHDTRYLRHDYVQEVIKAVKLKGGIPTLIETQGIGTKINNVTINEEYTVSIGCRKNASNHEKIAHLHGYAESVVGAPLRFIDGEDGFEGRKIQINGLSSKEVFVAAGLYDFDKIIAVSRFKGHAQAGFGGALKQIGMGCVTKLYKFLAHNENMLSVNPKKCNISLCKKECIDACSVEAIRIEGKSSFIDPSKCIGCFNCRSACPIKNAINRPTPNSVNKFVERVIDNVLAVLSSFGPENIRFINFAMEVTGQCDCIPNTNMPIIPDLGIFGSSDPVALDKACVDAEINAPGLPFLKPNGKWTQPEPPGIEKFKKLYGIVDTNLQFQAALKNKIGTTNYKLVNIL